MDFEELREKLKKDADTFPGKMQIILTRPEPESPDAIFLSDEAHVFRLASGDRVVSASMIKVPVLCCLLETLREKGLSLSDCLQVRDSDILEDSLVFRQGPGQVSFYELGFWMIVNSDNTAANVLMRYLGFARINDWCQRAGLRKTGAGRYMLDYDAVLEGRNNYTSPDDFAKLVCGCRLAEEGPEGAAGPGGICQKDARTVMDFLRANRDYDELLRYIWEEPVCAHKSGELDTVVHDAGIFSWQGKTWFLGVFTSGFEAGKMDYAKARCSIAEVSRQVFDYVTGTNRVF